MLFEIAKWLLIAAIMVAGIWWKLGRFHPTLQNIRLVTMNDELMTHRWIQTCPGVSIWVSGKTFSYRYERKGDGNVVPTKLTVAFQKARIGEPKTVLVVDFHGEQVRSWRLMRGKEQTSPDYRELYALQSILRIVENTIIARDAAKFNSAVYRPNW